MRQRLFLDSSMFSLQGEHKIPRLLKRTVSTISLVNYSCIYLIIFVISCFVSQSQYLLACFRILNTMYF